MIQRYLTGAQVKKYHGAIDAALRERAAEWDVRGWSLRGRSPRIRGWTGCCSPVQPGQDRRSTGNSPMTAEGKRLVERVDPNVWDVLDEVIKVVNRRVNAM